MTVSHFFRPSAAPRAMAGSRWAVVVAGLCAVGLTAGCAQDSSLNVGRAQAQGTATATAPAGSAPATTSATASTSSAPGAVPGGSPTGSALPAVTGPIGTSADLAVLGGVEIVDGDKPTLKIAKLPLQVSATTRQVVKAGAGPVGQAKSLLLIHAVVVKGSDGAQLESTFGGQAQTLQLSPNGTLKGLVTALAGAQKGSRVLIAVPPADSFEGKGNPQAGISETEHLLFLFDIIDVMAGQAEGSTVPSVAGLPQVTSFDTAAGPKISIPTGVSPPTTLVSQTLLEGTGPVVAAGQEISVHYTGFLWKDGSVFDSSWSRQQPFNVANLGQGQVISGWNKGFIGKKVGSRVLLVVPPAEGYGEAGSPPKISGTDTLVFVVDILGAH